MRRIRLLPWDSAFFDMPIGMVRANCLNARTGPAVIQEARQKKLRCLYFLAAPNPRTCAAAESLSFRLVDVSLSLKADIHGALKQKSFSTLPKALIIRAAQAQDIPALKRMAALVHRESRFAADSQFPRNAAARLFSEWIERSVHGHFDDQVWIAANADQPAGYVSIRKNGRIGLVGIAPRWQGKGIGTALLRKSFEWLRTHGVSESHVVTQGSNRSALEFYQRSGFHVAETNLWYHRWF